MNEKYFDIITLALKYGCEVREREPLSAHCTFRVGGECDVFIEVASGEALCELIRFVKENSVRYFVLGNGSNVLFSDEGYRGVILHVGQMMNKITLIDDTTICAQAGASLTRVCNFALENSLTGLEFSYGIPGYVGGAVFMNAGAYGGEVKDVFVSADAITPDGEMITVKADDMRFSYRYSALMDNGSLVVSAVFRLAKGDKSEIKAKMDELMGKRKAKQPIEYPSAGSTFKRPKDQFAGALIEQSGLRGYSVGGACVSEKHCGFVINKGGASAKDIMQVIKDVQKIVQEKTGFLLEPEVRLIPAGED
ncbi:MAG: UDP-N-acetylmuramate dehydrogenase [Ruminococcus sp.]|nr:UDP-N-acetylmuramate dehydrogenase [Ruminococcus sp.]